MMAAVGVHGDDFSYQGGLRIVPSEVVVDKTRFLLTDQGAHASSNWLNSEFANDEKQFNA
jgi:hypothetical protein